MKIIEPQVELWQQTDPIAHVAKCARVCYGKKEGKSTDQQLYDNLLKAKHNSMFRHESVYAIIPFRRCFGDISLATSYPWFKFACDKSFVYIATNKNFIIDNNNKNLITDSILNHRVTAEQFFNTEIGYSMMRYTFHITTQIGTSRELNRVSPNNIAERSTRYVNESEGVIVRPHWMSKEYADMFNKSGGGWEDIPEIYSENPAFEYLCGYCDAFMHYRELIEQGLKRQDARGVLPLDTATEVVYTYSIDEWRHIIELRASKRAHPNAQIIANMIKERLEQLGYDFK